MSGPPPTTDLPSDHAQCVHFDEFSFDPRSELLFRFGQPVDLPQLPSRALGALLARPGELVSHQELQQILWDDRVVSFEQSLHTCIRQIRKALGDSSSHPRYVQTLARRGYRFIGQIQTHAHANPNAAAPFGLRLRTMLLPGALVTLLLAALLLWATADSLVAHGSRHSLAIIPANALEQADSMASLHVYLREQLAAADPRRLQLVEAASVRALTEQGLDLPALASALDVDYLLGAKLLKPVGANARAWSLQLWDGGGQKLLWSQPLNLQSISTSEPPGWYAELAAKLGLHSAPSAKTRSPEWPNSQARNAYLTAAVLAESENADDLIVLEHLEQALSAAPDHPAALALKARSQFRMALRGDRDIAAAARATAGLALRRDPHNAAAATLLAWHELMFGGDLNQARNHLQLALSNPRSTSESWQALGALQMLEGDDQAALISMQKALEIDPYNAILKHDLGQYYLYLGQTEAAAKYCGLAADQHPGPAARPHLWCQLDAALLADDSATALQIAQRIGLPNANAAGSNAAVRDLDEFYLAWLRHLQQSAKEGASYPIATARLLIRLGRLAEAATELRSAINSRTPGWLFLRIDPVLWQINQAGPT